jgi:hypothetical protein
MPTGLAAIAVASTDSQAATASPQRRQHRVSRRDTTQ